MSKEFRFEGGPYNGNYFRVEDDRPDYSITSYSGRSACQHVYVKLNEDVYIYEAMILS